MHILAIGASRNIGYLATRTLLAENHTVTYLLRKPEVFDKDLELQKYIKNGQAKVIKGDATVKEDIRKAFTETSTNGNTLDAVLFSVGGSPSFTLTKGFVLNPPNLCSSSLFNVLACYPTNTPDAPQPKLIIISSNGLTDAGHAALPILIKPLFSSSALKSAHADKLVMERAVFHASNLTWPQKDPANIATFLGASWKDELKEPGYLKEVVIVRPSLLVNGNDSPPRGAYRTSTEELKGAYTISRKEVAHFVVEGVLKHWDQWRGKFVNITGK
ncbi:hypothetical protein M422DRAFT_31265 [Sphaerobolus stellatus SS14]|uniref:Unplaced genomic scaffold SPHSTscaffold_53, whole genome shotgun sequence n=1 Tax=Sphaerobolus stellatus (strain SS14) TaxID=990650 RepID=A0A0C9VVN2_SPHS4|nr:hypothetical protein M422DRAFT_31265 [Sphaerobolus stellatus SS14]